MYVYIYIYMTALWPSGSPGCKGSAVVNGFSILLSRYAQGSGGGSHGAVVYRGVPASALHPPWKRSCRTLKCLDITLTSFDL